ncbi:hypothetical protein H6F89_29825 [Cyanobacteria bacterium FACHB-63]|nr:hypothetical protein [Cyanobacteria bacterium FACHB-63]
MREWQDFHAAIQSAIAAPLEADCRQLCQLMDQCLISLPDAQCLQLGGDAIALIAEVLFLKTQLYQQQAAVLEVEPELEDSEGFPVLGEDDDRWERHTMSLDLEDDEEDWGKTRKTRSRNTDSPSIAAPVPPKRVLQMLKELAGDEDPAAWSKAIAQWLKRKKVYTPIPVSQIQQALRKLSPIELWLGLLLGGFPLEPSQNTEEDFYCDLSESGIWLIPALDE